jgi:hypothetical protein
MVAPSSDVVATWLRIADRSGPGERAGGRRWFME